jgi:hypothetical protein
MWEGLSLVERWEAEGHRSLDVEEVVLLVRLFFPSSLSDATDDLTML